MEGCYRIADFSSFLQVTVALHLGYSLIRDISHATARRFELHSEHLKRSFPDLDESAQGILRPLIAELDMEIFKLDRRLEPLVRWMIRVSIIAAVYGIGLLAYTGFSPDARVPLSALVVLLAPATLPVAIFLFVSYVIGLSASIPAGEKSIAAMTKFNRLVTGGHLTGKGRYVKQ
jgi:hypothetical protein